MSFLLAQQLPTHLDVQFSTSKLEDVAYERLLGLLDDAIQYSKLRRLSISLC